jgi:hypothetical protein
LRYSGDTDSDGVAVMPLLLAADEAPRTGSAWASGTWLNQANSDTAISVGREGSEKFIVFILYD